MRLDYTPPGEVLDQSLILGKLNKPQNKVIRKWGTVETSLSINGMFSHHLCVKIYVIK